MLQLLTGSVFFTDCRIRNESISSISAVHSISSVNGEIDDLLRVLGVLRRNGSESLDARCFPLAMPSVWRPGTWEHMVLGSSPVNSQFKIILATCWPFFHQDSADL